MEANLFPIYFMRKKIIFIRKLFKTTDLNQNLYLFQLRFMLKS